MVALVHVLTVPVTTEHMALIIHNIQSVFRIVFLITIILLTSDYQQVKEFMIRVVIGLLLQYATWCRCYVLTALVTVI